MPIQLTVEHRTGRDGKPFMVVEGLPRLGAELDPDQAHALGRQLADRQFVCQLEPVHLLLAFASALLIALLVAGIGGLRAIQIQPAESLRAL